MTDPSELSRAWTLALLQAWRHCNWIYLRRALREPQIRLSPDVARLGTWHGPSRTLSISERHIRRDPWHAVLDTLRHEMAHQYASEVLHSDDESPHGEAFRRACQLLRTEPRATATGATAAPDPGDGGADEAGRGRILELVRKVLAMAQSPNAHEAQTAARMARTLLLKHNLSEVELGQERSYQVRQLGPTKTRFFAHERILASILHEYFFVQVIWQLSFDPASGRRGAVLEVYGTRENVAMADYVHQSLLQQLESLWQDYKRARGVRGERERLRYFAGVLRGFEKKLAEQEKTVQQETALVWVGDRKLDEFFRWRNPRVRMTWSSGPRDTAAYRDGVQAGRSVTIRKPLERGGSGLGGYLT